MSNHILIYALSGIIIGFILKHMYKRITGKNVNYFVIGCMLLGVLLYVILNYKDGRTWIELYDKSDIEDKKELYMSDKDEERVCKPDGCDV